MPGAGELLTARAATVSVPSLGLIGAKVVAARRADRRVATFVPAAIVITRRRVDWVRPSHDARLG